MDAYQGLPPNLTLALLSVLQLHSLFISDKQRLALQTLSHYKI